MCACENKFLSYLAVRFALSHTSGDKDSRSLLFNSLVIQ